MPSAVLAFSGGPASTAVLWDLRRQSYRVRCVHVDYGQASARCEHAAAAMIVAAAAHGRRPGAEIDLVAKSAGFPPELTPSTPAAENRFHHYALTVLQAAFAEALATGADRVVCAAGIERVREGVCEHLAALLSLLSRDRVGLDAPVRDRGQPWIFRQGWAQGAPLDDTWSCLEGGALHCGVCRGCAVRRQAFSVARKPDWTRYACTLRGPGVVTVEDRRNRPSARGRRALWS